MIRIILGRGNNKLVTTLYKFYALREMLRENRHCDLVQRWQIEIMKKWEEEQ